MSRTCFFTAIATAAALGAAAPVAAQSGAPISLSAQPAVAPVPQPANTSAPTVAPPPAVAGTIVPADYVIGIDDALDVVYWQDKDMSASVVVRPDGNISLPLLNDIKAAGLTPEELRGQVAKAATKFVEDPTVSVVVKAINSRKVFITGQVSKPGTYLLTDTTTVLQMIAVAGGVAEYAKKDQISVVRRENGKDVVHKFNYKDVSKGKAMAQNITLKPGDTIVVP